MNFSKTANEIFNDKVNGDNIKYFLSEWYDFTDRQEKRLDYRSVG